MKYNTARKRLVLPEHGRNIHQMVDYLKTVEDEEERNRAARAVIKLMGQLNPHLRDVEDFNHKLYDHLYIMAEYDLEINSPYPVPEKEVIERKPDPLAYPNQRIKYRHYGRSIERMIKEAVKYEEGEEKAALIGLIANMMKRFYLKWNRDSVNDEVIWHHLEELSEGQLKRPEGFEMMETYEILRSNVKKRKDNKGGSKGGHKNHSNKKKHYSK